jgi:hypothetical protein
LRDRPENEIEIKMNTDLKWEVRRGIRERGEGDVTFKISASSFASYYLLQSISTQSPCLSPSSFNLDMEMKLGPARVCHEDELATLFSSPTNAHTEAEMLLSSIGDTPHFNRSRQTRDLLLSSHHGIVIGHLVDNHGYQRTDLMLMHMGMITPKTAGPGDRVDMSDLDIQYGTGLVHFYPNLGGEAPVKWEIPYLIPDKAEGLVSLTTLHLNEDANVSQVPPPLPRRSQVHLPFL